MRLAEFVAVLISVCGLVHVNAEINEHKPVIVSSTIEGGIPIFHGTIRENERIVSLNPTILATDEDEGKSGLICSYSINSQKKRHIPFTIKVTNQQTGAAELELVKDETLNFEKRQGLKFFIEATDCGVSNRTSDRAEVIIQVEDMNEFPPHFDNTYFVEVEEGRIIASVIQVEANDKDRSPTYHAICSYEIINDADKPFLINKKGVISTTEALDYSIHHNYILEVVATDCGARRSEPVMVNIQVVPRCDAGWRGIQDGVDYFTGSGRQLIAEHAHLQMCERTCEVKKVSVDVRMTTKHIGKGCDRDTYSATSQRKLCGASTGSVDLLPSPTLGTVWTKHLPTDDGHASDQIFAFDGKTNAVEIPEGHFHHAMKQHFTFSVWMKHEKHGKQSPKHHLAKEHILCMSDGEKMNRHHYAWFIHGEKIVFLLRREPDDNDDMERFKPAEWRWHIPQINDGDWHHYAVSVDFPGVRLYIDGRLLVPDEHNQEIVDDWPLHSSKKVHFTKLVIGACWQGRLRHFDGFFNGYLAGLTALKDKTESDRVIKCLNNCKENLDFRNLDNMQSGTSVSLNSDMTEISITGKTVDEVEKLMREVAYVNARHYPTPGRRNIKIATAVECGSGEQLSIPTFDTYVEVIEAPEPMIFISSSNVIARTVQDLYYGIKPFIDVHVTVSLKDDEYADEDEDVKEISVEDVKGDMYDNVLLDSCTIRAEPPLELRNEYLRLPHHLMDEFGMGNKTSETNDGLVIMDADKIQNYMKVLKGIIYIHKDADQMSHRDFILSCSTQNGRFVSNEVKIQIVALHEEPRTQPYARIQDAKAMLSNNKAYSDVFDSNLNANTIASTPNVGMAAIIVVCVGFLLFMIILGVIRIRAAHKRTQVVTVDEKQEMEWDNTALNIIVNPMDTEPFDDNPTQALRDDSDSDDDSCHEEMDSSEEETNNQKELEWDNSM